LVSINDAHAYARDSEFSWNTLMGKFVPAAGVEFRTAAVQSDFELSRTSSDKSPAEPSPGTIAGALILGGAHGSLAVARSLGRRGIDVWFATHDHPITKYSRYTKRGVEWPGPNHPAAVDWLLAFAARWKLNGWVLIPGADPELRLLSQNYQVLSQVFHIAAPTWSVAQWAHDKRLTEQHARAVGIAAPRSIYPANAAQLADWPCTFPVILKPTVHDVPNPFTRAKAWRADDRATLMTLYNEAVGHVGANAIVIQEMIAGGGEAQFSYAGVWNNGQPIAAMVARRTRQFPLDFGFTSTFVETIDRPEVAESAEKFLRALNFTGLVELEFKYDARDGLYKLLDVNARVWAWAGIGEAAKLDFPYLAYRIALGETIAPVGAGRSASWVHASRNVVAAMQELARGRTTIRNLMPVVGRPMAFAAFAIDDPMPGLMEMPLTLGRTLTRRLKSIFGHAV
jgi:predicted ATP-grasp superfamily ATP-dependent carboligase